MAVFLFTYPTTTIAEAIQPAGRQRPARKCCCYIALHGAYRGGQETWPLVYVSWSRNLQGHLTVLAGMLYSTMGTHYKPQRVVQH